MLAPLVRMLSTLDTTEARQRPRLCHQPRRLLPIAPLIQASGSLPSLKAIATAMAATGLD